MNLEEINLIFMYVRFHTWHISVVHTFKLYINDVIVCMLSLQLVVLIQDYICEVSWDLWGRPYSTVFPCHSLPAHRWTDICVPTFQGSRLCRRSFCYVFWNFHVRLSPGSLSASGIVDLGSVSIFTLFRHPQSFLMRGHQFLQQRVWSSLLLYSLAHAWHC